MRPRWVWPPRQRPKLPRSQALNPIPWSGLQRDRIQCQVIFLTSSSVKNSQASRTSWRQIRLKRSIKAFGGGCAGLDELQRHALALKPSPQSRLPGTPGRYLTECTPAILIHAASCFRNPWCSGRTNTAAGRVEGQSQAGREYLETRGAESPVPLLAL